MIVNVWCSYVPIYRRIDEEVQKKADNINELRSIRGMYQPQDLNSFSNRSAGLGPSGDLPAKSPSIPSPDVAGCEWDKSSRLQETGSFGIRREMLRQEKCFADPAGVCAVRQPVAKLPG